MGLALIPWLLLSSACTAKIDIEADSGSEGVGEVEQALTTPWSYDDFGTGGVRTFSLSGRKWNHRDLSYFFANGTADIAANDEQRSVREAMLLWSLESPITFTETASEAGADIVIKWVTGNHGDDTVFGVPGAPLAHAFYPPPGTGTLPGDVHFDDGRAWTTNFGTADTEPLDLVTIAAHELGHSLGLEHSPVGSALLWHSYKGSRRYLAADDLDGIQQLYGSGQPISVRPIGSGVPSLLVRGPDNHLWENSWTGSTWVWTDHGGSLGSSPSTLIYKNSPYVFTRESDGTLALRNLATMATRNLGGSFAGAPAAVAWGTNNNNMSAFIRGTDNALWEARWNGFIWSMTSHGDSILTTPAPMVTGANAIAVFVMRADHTLAARWFDGSNWFWGSHGGELTSAPVAFGDGKDFKVFARGSDNNLWERYWTGSAWAWSAHGGPIRGTPTIASASSVFVRGGDDQLYQNWWNGSTWVWVSHGVSCTSSPTASNVFGTHRVFMRSATGSIGERYWAGSQWLSLDHGPSVLLP